MSEFEKSMKNLNKKINEEKGIIILVLVIITCTVGICIWVNKYISRKIYLEKWKDYEECGTDSY